jgi:hypothetical protein
LWQGVGTDLARGLEGSQARALLSLQIALCKADAIVLEVALENDADTSTQEDVGQATAALAEARVIEAKAREWLGVISLPCETPSEEELARGVAAYERGETLDMRDASARLRARRP